MKVCDQRSLEALAAAVGELLLANGECLATAESCTGGWVGQCATAIAGSSRWFERGFVTYSNEAKIEMLGVDAELLVAQGAVSEGTAARQSVRLGAGDHWRRRSGWRLSEPASGDRLLCLGRTARATRYGKALLCRRAGSGTRTIGGACPPGCVAAGRAATGLRLVGSVSRDEP